MSEAVEPNASSGKKLDIQKLLKSVLAFKSSDLHLVVGSEPQIRIDKELRALNLPVLSASDIEEMAYSLLEDKKKKEFEEHMDSHSAYDPYQRETAKSFLRQSHTSFIQNLIQRVEGERCQIHGTQYTEESDLIGKGFNAALDTIIKMLKEEIE
jgi:Tfp pilus assembly pilus retraction ATPase PilT